MEQVRNMGIRKFTAVFGAVLLMLGSIGMAAAQNGTINIALNGDSISADGAGVTVNGSTVTITAAGTYNLTGTLADGQVVVDSQGDGVVTLILNGVEIRSSTSAPIYIKQADSAVITLADGTQNTLVDGANYVYANADEDEPDATLFSDDDLTIDGSGSLSIEANYDHAIVGKDTLTVNGTPTITINAVGDGLNANDLLTINGGTFTINAGDDGLQSDQDLTVNAGTLTITAVGDGIHSEYALNIVGGTIDILNSEEGIEGAYITFDDGTTHVVSSDDAINVSAPDEEATTTTASGTYMLRINGGTIVVDAEGDGLDSNGSIEMTGGVVIVNGPTQSMNGAMDYDGSFNITGGLLIAAGSASMPQAPNASSQNSLMVNFTSSLAAGTLVRIQSSTGDELLTFAPSKAFQSLVFSSPELATGATYDIYYGGSAEGSATDGLYAESSYTAGTLESSFAVTDAVTMIGQMQGRFGGGGRPR